MNKLLLVFLAATSVSAETISVGSLPFGRSLFVSIASTVIDTSRPATANGSVTTATIEWGNAGLAGCDNAFTIRFYQPYPTTVGLIAERVVRQKANDGGPDAAG